LRRCESKYEARETRNKTNVILLENTSYS